MSIQVFISHSNQEPDKSFAMALARELGVLGVSVWLDHRELVAGNLDEKIIGAIQECRAVLTVWSLHSTNSAWVLKENRLAMEVRKKKPGYLVIPLLMGEGITHVLVEALLGEPMKCLTVGEGAGRLQAVLGDVLAALGLRTPSEAPATLKPTVQPLEELVLIFSNPRLFQEESKVRVQADGELEFHPSQGTVMEGQRFTLTAPLGLIEAEELAWYLEIFPRWPGEAFRYRAKEIEQKLPEWGKALFAAALDQPEGREVRQAWERAAASHGRRLTVRLKKADNQQAAAQLLSLPWELLHNGERYLFHGRTKVRVRRRLFSSQVREPLFTKPPLRVLFVSPRPEDKTAGFIDHRVTALPVVETLSALGELAELTILAEPSFVGMVNELQAAEDGGKPYHVVHFDGHGVYLQQQGLGALCFEMGEQGGKLVKRATHVVTAKELAERLAGYRIPLFFLEACQGAKAEVDPASSVAATLMQQGVAAVVAMSHSVLVATAREFVKVFYESLAKGGRVGEAMLKGQERLHDHRKRGHYLGAGQLELHDWFVPVLYQEGEDVSLVAEVVQEEMKELIHKRRVAMLGGLPESPPHHFVGRSRELLALERLLLQEKYGVVLGEGGEGKTALACEAARWLQAIGRVERVAFVSLEHNTHWNAVVDVLGQQLVEKHYRVATFADEELALVPIEGALRQKPTLLVLDNMETVLPPQSGGLAQAHDPEGLQRLLALFRRLLGVGKSRLLFTSREKMPSPFDAGSHHVDIGALSPWDGVELVKNVLHRQGLTPFTGGEDEKEQSLLDLVESVHGHARTLVMLAPELARQGMFKTTASLHQLMTSLEQRYPGQRERSLYAGVALSLNRLSPETRQLIRPLGVLQGGGHAQVIGYVLDIDNSQLNAIIGELVQTKLCDIHEYGYITFHFALCPFLWGEMSQEEQAGVRLRWLEVENAFLDFLNQQLFQDSQLSASLTLLDLNNLLAGLAVAAEVWPVERTMNWATAMSTLLQHVGGKSAREMVGRLRGKLTARLAEGWSRVHFLSESSRLESLAAQGLLMEVWEGAKSLLQKCKAAGEQAYEGAGYDLALAYFDFGRYTRMAGDAAQALPLLQEARRRFQQLASGGNQSGQQMAAAALSDMGDCLRHLGRLEDAAQCYQQSMQEDEQRGDQRGVAVSQGQLGTVRLEQGQYQEALTAYEKARETFSRLQELASVAVSWHQTGRVYEEMQAWSQAEDAYRHSLEIRTKLNNLENVAATLLQLGNLFDAQNRWEEAVVQYRKALTIRVQMGNLANEGLVRNNLAATLLKLHRLAEARREIQWAIECRKDFGHGAELWKSLEILANIETADNQPQAAAQARRQARQLFASYRRDGGENHEAGAKLCRFIGEAIGQGQIDEAKQALVQIANDPETRPRYKALIATLLHILDGQRQPELAEREDLYYRDAVEVERLLEQLAK